jgi:hypothetical protein
MRIPGIASLQNQKTNKLITSLRHDKPNINTLQSAGILVASGTLSQLSTASIPQTMKPHSGKAPYQKVASKLKETLPMLIKRIPTLKRFGHKNLKSTSYLGK